MAFRDGKFYRETRRFAEFLSLLQSPLFKLTLHEATNGILRAQGLSIGAAYLRFFEGPIFYLDNRQVASQWADQLLDTLEWVESKGGVSNNWTLKIPHYSDESAGIIKDDVAQMQKWFPKDRAEIVDFLTDLLNSGDYPKLLDRDAYQHVASYMNLGRTQKFTGPTAALLTVLVAAGVPIAALVSPDSHIASLNIIKVATAALPVSYIIPKLYETTLMKQNRMSLEVISDLRTLFKRHEFVPNMP